MFVPRLVNPIELKEVHKDLLIGFCNSAEYLLWKGCEHLLGPNEAEPDLC